jgi:hypothetical protein
MAASGSFTNERYQKKDERILDHIHVSQKSFTSNDLRAGFTEEQREIRDFKRHLWLRERVPMAYDMWTHVAYIGSPSFCCLALAVYMSGRVRNNTLATMTKPFWFGSALVGAGAGQITHQFYHMERWTWADEMNT